MEELFDRLEDVLNEIGANCKSTETQSALIFMFKALYKMREAEPANEAETGQTCPNCGGSGVDITLGKAGSCYCVNGTGHV